MTDALGTPLGDLPPLAEQHRLVIAAEAVRSIAATARPTLATPSARRLLTWTDREVSMPIGTFTPNGPDGVTACSIDLGALLPAGVDITGASAMVALKERPTTQTPDFLAPASPTIAGTVVTAVVEGGREGRTYLVVFTVERDDGGVEVLSGELPCRT